MRLMLLAWILLQAGTAGGQGTPTTRAHAWLTAVYPALRRGDVSVDVHGDAVTTRVVVHSRKARLVPGEDTTGPVLLVADLHRSKVTGRIEAIQTSGPLVNSARVSALADSIASHPEWGTADIAAVIVAAGGRFPPGTRNALLAQLPAFVDVLGTVAAVQQVSFGGNNRIAAVWLVDVTVGARVFRLTVEPFDGQVIGLIARS